MEGVLAALRQEYGDRMQVDFIDVAVDPDAGKKHGIKLIPTQILFAPDGTELFRHEGFFAKDAILATWQELGYPMAEPGTTEEIATEPEPAPGLFARLTSAVEQGALVALVAAGIWGVLSIVLSPCHLASIPLIVGFIQEQGTITTRRACATATLFSLGILATIAALGVATAAMGRVMGDVGPTMNYVVAAVFLVVGMHLLDLLPAPWGGPGNVSMKRRGLWAALILGLVFGIALGPCTFAYMAPVLATTLKVGGSRPMFAAGLLIAYGLGHCSVIILAGTSSEWVQRYLNWNQESGGAVWVRRICGLLVLFGGLYLVRIA
jgi:cytochrome c-type biogenesis protein